MPESIFKVKLLPDGRLEYEDYRGRVVACAPHELGLHLRTVLLEPDLPPVERLSSGGVAFVDAVARNVLPPHLQPHIGPITSLAMQIFDKVRAVAHARAQAQYHEHQQPYPPPPSNPPPHDSAFRRGHRVG